MAAIARVGCTGIPGSTLVIRSSPTGSSQGPAEDLAVVGSKSKGSGLVIVWFVETSAPRTAARVDGGCQAKALCGGLDPTGIAERTASVHRAPARGSASMLSQAETGLDPFDDSRRRLCRGALPLPALGPGARLAAGALRESSPDFALPRLLRMSGCSRKGDSHVGGPPSHAPLRVPGLIGQAPRARIRHSKGSGLVRGWRAA
jgi:hypothetical protein